MQGRGADQSGPELVLRCGFESPPRQLVIVPTRPKCNFLLCKIIRLKAAVHYTVGCLCEEVALDKEMQFSKQTIAAISELTFRQCENFAKDLEMFARHAKRTTINTEDVKLLARRSNSLLKYITDKSEEIAQINLERKAQKKKKSEDGGKNSREPAEAGVVESEN
nr:centromere protein S isoform X2 [Macaca fascicularis]